MSRRPLAKTPPMLAHALLRTWCAGAWLYAQFLRLCVASTDSYMRSRFEDGLANTRSLQAWALERDREMRTIQRLENLRHLQARTTPHSMTREAAHEHPHA